MLAEWWRDIPVVTRTYMTLAMVTTVSCGMDILSPFQIYLNFQLVYQRYEIWRLITNFCYFGKFGLEFMFHMFFLVRHCRMLEESARFRDRPADFLWMMILGGLAMLAACSVLALHFLGSSLTFMVVYVWARRHPTMRMSLLGLFQFSAAYLPFVFLSLSWLLSGSVGMKLDLLGIFVGHTYYFLEDIYPHLGGPRLLQTPKVLHFLFGTSIEDPVETFAQPVGGTDDGNDNRNEPLGAAANTDNSHNSDSDVDPSVSDDSVAS